MGVMERSCEEVKCVMRGRRAVVVVEIRRDSLLAAERTSQKQTGIRKGDLVVFWKGRPFL